MSDKIGMKKVSDSRTEAVHNLRYPDINGQNRLFGGRLMEWIDEVGAVAAMRHAGMDVTTASIEHLEFKRGAYLNDLVVMVACVTYVGRTSMQVRVDTYIEDLATGMRREINRAFLTEVCVDSEGKPVPVPYGLELETISDQANWEAAKKRIAQRKKARAEGY